MTDAREPPVVALMPHPPLQYAADRALGRHDGRDIHLHPGDAPAYVRRYAAAHELVHDHLFSATPDGLLHTMILQAARPEGAAFRSEAVQVAEFMWNEMRAPHERAATFIAAMQEHNGLHRNILIRGFPAEYREYFQFFQGIFDGSIPPGPLQAAAGWALASWSFRSTRLTDVPARDAFDISAYERIPGPSARMELARDRLTPAITRDWMKDGLEYVSQLSGVNRQKIEASEFWLFDYLENSGDLADKLARFLKSTLEDLVGVSTAPHAFEGSELAERLLEGATVTRLPRAVFPEAAGTIREEKAILAHARQGDRLLAYRQVQPERWASISDFRTYVANMPRADTLHTGIVWCKPDDLVITASRRDSQGMEVFSISPGLIGFSQACAIMTALRDAHANGLDVAPVTICVEPRNWDNELEPHFLCRSLASHWRAATRYTPSLDGLQTQPTFMPLIAVGGSWSQVAQKRRGILYSATLEARVLLNEEPIIFSFLDDGDGADEADWPLVNISPPAAASFHGHFVQHLERKGALSLRPLPNDSPFMDHLILASWRGLNLFREIR